MSRKRVNPPAKPEPYVIPQHNVCAPDALNISPNNRNGSSLVAWWEKASVYIEAMDALDRVVMFAPDGEGGYWLASHPNNVRPRD